MHLLIDWTCSFDNLNKRFPSCLCVIDKIKMDKLKNKSEIISKLYKTKVDDFRGATEFNLYIIRDTSPNYDYRKTSKGLRKVNTNVFDFKKTLRKITGGYKIHATDNIQETKENLKVLGLFDKYYKQKKFDSLQDVFVELNKHNDLKWIVMRNFESMPNEINIDEHLDVDVLVNDYYLIKRILDGTSATNNTYEDGKTRILNYVVIDNKQILFDFRQVGDNYYDKNLQQGMLKTRVKHPNGFYIPNEEYHLYSLIYHAVIHKKKISKTYLNIFKKYKLKDDEINRGSLMKTLDIFMKNNGYEYVKPEPSVGYYLYQ